MQLQVGADQYLDVLDPGLAAHNPMYHWLDMFFFSMVVPSYPATWDVHPESTGNS